VQYVFATNGHRYDEFDAGTGLHACPLPLADFPSHAALSARYALDKGLDIGSPEAALLFQVDS
jgi:type I restriction enzyme R subunit